MSGPHGSHWLEREDFGDVTVVRLKTPRTLDDDVIRTVFDPIYSLVGSVGRKKLVLNLTHVGYLPSMALGKMVMLNRRIQVDNGRLALCHLSPVTEEILEGTRLKSLFHCYPTEAEAVGSFA
jgi:anti-sigma B factor antagonist